MIEELLLNGLEPLLPGLVFLKRPKNPPEQFVLFEKTGSGENNQLPNATIAFQSYAPTLYEAAKLNEQLKSAIKQLSMTSQRISKVKLNTDYDFTDTETKEYRYQAVFDIFYY